MPLPSNLLPRHLPLLRYHQACQGNEDEPVNMFGKPAESHVRLEHDDVRNGDRINGERIISITKLAWWFQSRKRH